MVLTVACDWCILLFVGKVRASEVAVRLSPAQRHCL